MDAQPHTYYSLFYEYFQTHPQNHYRLEREARKAVEDRHQEHHHTFFLPQPHHAWEI